MKNFLHSTFTKVVFAIILLNLFLATESFANQFNGNFTINPSLPVSATNYKNFASALSDLTSGTRTGSVTYNGNTITLDGGTANGAGGATFGVNGKVYFGVTGTFNENINIPAINGASSSNTITFDGGSTANTQITGTLPFGGTPTNYCVRFNQCSYITVKNITIAPVGTWTVGYPFWGVQFLGTTTSLYPSNDSIANCIINMDTLTSATSPANSGFGLVTAPTWVGVMLSGTNPNTTGNVANVTGYYSNITVANCAINRGVCGIYSTSNSSGPCTVNIVGNTIKNFCQAGVSLISVLSPKIENNIISSNVNINNSFGMIMNGCSNATGDYIEVSGNSIISAGRYATYFAGNSGSSAQPVRYYNNFYYLNSTLTTQRGMNLANAGNTYINIWNNSFVVASAAISGNGCMVFDANPTNMSIRNNIFAYYGGSTCVPVVIPAIAGVTAFDNNVFWNTTGSPANVATINGTVYTSSNVLNTSYSGSPTFNINSVVADPHFVSTTYGSQDLHITALPGTCNKGVYLSGSVPTDYDGQTRANPPTIGADELTASVSPSTASVCPGAPQVLTASPGATWSPSSYTWVPTANLSPTTGATVTASPTVATTYTVSAIDANGCTAAQGSASIGILACGFNISASAGSNGSISPSGVVSVTPGANQTFTITPNACYTVATVTVDGSTVTPAGSYTFTNVTVTHTIAVTFALSTYTITTSTGANGSISPTNPAVNCGGNQTFTLTPSGCYSVITLTVDGSTVTPAGSYTFNNVTATHTISATFGYIPLAISVTPSPASICLSGSSLTASGAGGLGTYAWSPSTGLSATTGATVTATQSGSLTYTIIGTTSVGCTGSTTVAATPAVPMSGVYNINSTASGAQLYSNGGRYFVNFPTAIAALTCAGISAPVIVNVAAGTYTGNNVVPAITGAGGHGGADSIIFDGGSAATTTLTQTGYGNNTTFYMLNASYITIKNFTITCTFALANSTANFWGVAIVGNPGTVSHNDVIGCTINMATQSASVTVSGPIYPAWAGIVVDGENDNTNMAPNVAGYFSNIYISGNIINNGHYGIYADGSNAAPSEVNIVGNTITGFSTFGITLNNLVCPKIRNNVVNGGASSTSNGANNARGIAMNTAYNQSSTTDWVEISGNNITCFSRYGILLNGACGIAAQPTRIYNNMIYMYGTVAGGSPLAERGISTISSTFGVGNNYINYWNNAIVMNTISTNGSGALSLDNGAANSDIRNNILAYIGPSTGLPILIPTLANVTAFDYNIFYNTSPTPGNEGSIGGTTYTNTPGATYILNNNYGGATTFNANSVVTDPHFVNTTFGSQDLHITQQCNRGDAYVLTSSPMSVTTDYDGQARPWPGQTQPNIGVDEIVGNSPTISVTAPLSPTAICSGNNVTLSASCSVNCTSISYTWSPSTGLSATTGSSVSAGPTLAATYTYTVTGTNNFGCTATATTPAITVNPLPVFSVSPPSGNICNGDVLGLTASGATTYSWLPSTSLSSGIGSSVSATPSATTTYTVTGATSFGCTANVIDIVTVKLTPPVAVTPNNAVCTGGTTATLVASGAVSYVWSPTSNLTPSNGTSATETAQISQLTFYTVTGTGSNSCTASVVVPVATVATGGTISPVYSIICSGGTKPLTVSGAAGHNYQWQISVDNANWSDISGATNTTYTTNTTDGNTNKYYRLQAQSNSCWNVASTTAEVDVSQPTINVTTSALTDNSVTLNWAPIGSGNYTINYTGASTGTVLGTTPPKTLNGLTANGNYTITLNQTGAGLGTCPASGTATVTTLCPAPTAVTIISTGTNSITLTWTGGAGNYRVYYRPLYVNNGYFTKDVIGGTSTSLTKQGSNSLYHSLTYEIYVTKLDCPALGNVGQPSAKVYATTTPALACAAPVIDSVKSACPVQLEVFMHGSPTNQYFIDVERLTPTIQPVQSFPVTGSYFTANVSAGQNYLITARSRCGIAVSNMTLWPGALQVKPQCGTLNNLLLSNPTCNGFTASWNADQCLANNASYYELYIRQVGTLNWNGYGVIIPTYPIGPYKVVSWLNKGKSYDVYAKAVYSCNGYLTYGATTQTTRITTLSAGCREEASSEEQLKPITQQTSADNSEVFTLYPNPNSGKFTVDLSRLNTNEDAVRIEVTNILGQTVITQLTSISDGHLTEFINMPLSTAAGTYIVRVTAGKNVYTSKMNISK